MRPRNNRARAFGILLLCVVASCEKPEPRVEIPPPIPIAEWAERVDTLAGTYTFTTSPLQYGDSVIVVADSKDRIVWRIDLKTGAREQLGSQGDGPGEYRRTGTPAKVHGDSVALLFGTAYAPIPVLSVATGRGRTHRIPIERNDSNKCKSMRTMGAPSLRWTDSLGNVYGSAYDRKPQIDSMTCRLNSRLESLDTIPIVRYGFFSGKVDTIAAVRRGVTYRPNVRDVKGGIAMSDMQLANYGPFNNWISSQDGNVLIADASTSHVQMFRDAGAPLIDRIIESNEVRVSKDGWDAFVKKETDGNTIEIAKLQKEVFGRMGVAVPAQPKQQYIVPPMPRVLPRLSFGDGWRHMFAHKNIVWFPMHIADPPTDVVWDLIDISSGNRIQRITLAKNEYLVQVTNLGAYVVAKDEDDLQRIILYRHKQ